MRMRPWALSAAIPRALTRLPADHIALPAWAQCLRLGKHASFGRRCNWQSCSCRRGRPLPRALLTGWPGAPMLATIAALALVATSAAALGAADPPQMVRFRC